MNTSSMPNRKWLREASFRRLSLLVKDKTEIVDNVLLLQVNLGNVDGLEDSGLTPVVKQHLHRWVDGTESGRQCMLAILDCKLQLETSSTSTSSSDSVISKDFQPLELVRNVLNLPEQFLCDSGYLYENIFGRPPSLVIKESMKMIMQKAYEQSSFSALELPQVNLALKQLRIEAMCTASTQVHSSSSHDNVENINKNAPAPTKNELVLYTNIIIELIRIHILRLAMDASGKTLNRDDIENLATAQLQTLLTTNTSHKTSIYSADQKDEDSKSSNGLDFLKGGQPPDKLPEMTMKTLHNFLNMNPFAHEEKKANDEKKASEEMKKANEENKATEENTSEKKDSCEVENGNSDAPSATTSEAAKEVAETPKAEENSETKAAKQEEEDDEIELQNHQLRDYLTKLSSLKHHLSNDLKKLRVSKGYLALGINTTNISSITIDMIKKAYKKVAVKLHPDKPTGNTQKFQQLQVLYQEILASHEQYLQENAHVTAANDAFYSSMDTFASSYARAKKQRKASKKQKKENKENKARTEEFEEDEPETLHKMNTKASKQDRVFEENKPAPTASKPTGTGTATGPETVEEEDSEDDILFDEKMLNDDDFMEKYLEKLEKRTAKAMEGISIAAKKVVFEDEQSENENINLNKSKKETNTSDKKPPKPLDDKASSPRSAPTNDFKAKMDNNNNNNNNKSSIYGDAKDKKVHEQKEKLSQMPSTSQFGTGETKEKIISTKKIGKVELTILPLSCSMDDSDEDSSDDEDENENEEKLDNEEGDGSKKRKPTDKEMLSTLDPSYVKLEKLMKKKINPMVEILSALSAQLHNKIQKNLQWFQSIGSVQSTIANIHTPGTNAEGAGIDASAKGKKKKSKKAKLQQEKVQQQQQASMNVHHVNMVQTIELMKEQLQRQQERYESNSHLQTYTPAYLQPSTLSTDTKVSNYCFEHLLIQLYHKFIYLSTDVEKERQRMNHYYLDEDESDDDENDQEARKNTTNKEECALYRRSQPILSSIQLHFLQQQYSYPYPVHFKPTSYVSKTTAATTHPAAASSSSSTSTTVPSEEDGEGLEMKTLIIPSIEMICEYIQSIVQLLLDYTTTPPNAMYAAMAKFPLLTERLSSNGPFVKMLESTMQETLIAMRSIIPFVTGYQQCLSIYERFLFSYQYAMENGEIADVLMTMFFTTMTTLSKNMMNSINVSMTSLLSCLTLPTMIQETIHQYEAHFQQYQAQIIAQQKARYQEQQQEMEYCEEDREMLQKLREEQMKTPEKEKTQEEKEKDDEEEEANGADGKDGDEKKGKATGKDNGKLSEGENVLMSLRAKIIQLQKQLQMQQIQALQKLNSEVITLQHELFSEIQQLPLHNSENLLDVLQSSMKQFRQQTGQHIIVAKHEEGGSKLTAKKAASTTASTTTAAAAQQAQHSLWQPKEPNSLVESVLTLIAECIDNAVQLFRNDFAGPPGKKKEGLNMLLVQGMVEKHFIWLHIPLITNHSSSTYKCYPHIYDLIMKQCVEYNEKQHQIYSIPVPASASIASSMKCNPIALLPDYRSKMIHFASLLNVSLVEELLQQEFPKKLQEILQDILVE